MRFTVYWEVPAFAHHYLLLTEAADNSLSLVLASISRLLEKKVRKIQFSDLGPHHLAWEVCWVLFLPYRNLASFFGMELGGMKQAKIRGSRNWDNLRRSLKLKCWGRRKNPAHGQTQMLRRVWEGHRQCLCEAENGRKSQQVRDDQAGGSDSRGQEQG